MAIRKAIIDFSNEKDCTVTTVIEKDDDGNFIILDSFVGIPILSELLEIQEKYEKYIVFAFGVPLRFLR